MLEKILELARFERVVVETKISKAYALPFELACPKMFTLLFYLFYFGEFFSLLVLLSERVPFSVLAHAYFFFSVSTEIWSSVTKIIFGLFGHTFWFIFSFFAPIHYFTFILWFNPFTTVTEDIHKKFFLCSFLLRVFLYFLWTLFSSICIYVHCYSLLF